MKGKAKRLFDAITPKDSIDNVLKALISKCAKPKEAVLYKFYGRKFKLGESITDNACELKEFLDEASPGLTIEQQIPFLRFQLCMQLPEHMRALIQFNSNLSWDDLLSALDKSFPHVAAANSGSSFQSPSSSFYPSCDQFSNPLIKSEPVEANYGETRQANNRLRSQPRQSQRFNGTCDYCKKIGHKYSECRSRLRDLNNQSGSNGSSNRQYNRNQNTFRNPNPGNSFQNDNSARKQHRGGNNSATNSNEATEIEFPDFGDVSNIQVAHLTNIQTTHLIKVKVRLSLFCQPVQEVEALCDGGSTHSFISPDILTTNQKQIAADKTSSLFRIKNFVISNASGETKSACCVTKVSLEIGQWSGEHVFIISGAITKHEMILGRDFFKAHSVVVDHGRDILQIGPIKVNLSHPKK